MPIHLQDFMGLHPWLLWLSVIALFVAAELLWRRRVFLTWTLALAVGALVAVFWPSSWWVQLVAALVVGLLCHRWLRPWLLRQLPEPRAAR